MRNFKVAILFFIATLALYALVLYVFPDLQLWIPSYAYHVIILAFPLALIVWKREDTDSLGLIWGKWKLGIPAALALIIISFLVWWFLNRRFVMPSIDHVFLTSVTWAPAAEELLFRGYLQPALENKTGKWPGLIITSLLFGIAHLPKIYLRQAATLYLVPEAFILGFIFGIMRDHTDSIYYGTFCHMAYNLIVTII